MQPQGILLVDDSSLARLMIKDILQANSYAVVGEAENGKAALEMYKKINPMIVIMDIIMPVMDGMEALKEILGYNPQAKIIIVSAISEREYIDKAMQLGTFDYITKPFDEMRLLAAIGKILEKE